MLLVPTIVLFGLFVYWPVLQVLILSFFNWNLISPNRTFVGFDNYEMLFHSDVFLALLWQSLLYIVIAVVGNFIVPLVLAALTLSVGRRTSGAYQALYFTPTVIATSVAALLWSWIYIPVGGLLNSLLDVFNISGHNWLNDPNWALVSVGAVSVWKFLGFNFLISLAGLRAVPPTYLEAAKIDGANLWSTWRYIMIPLLTPTLVFLALTTILQALPNAFIPIQILTQGGPSGVSNNILYAVFEDSFQFFQIGKSSAEAIVMMLLLGGLAIWQFRILDKRLDYAE